MAWLSSSSLQRSDQPTCISPALRRSINELTVPARSSHPASQAPSVISSSAALSPHHTWSTACSHRPFSAFFPVIYSVKEASSPSTLTELSSSSSSALAGSSPARGASSSSHHSNSIDHQHSNISSGTTASHRSWSDIFRHAGARALGGGIPGSAAMVVQVGCCSWRVQLLSNGLMYFKSHF